MPADPARPSHAEAEPAEHGDVFFFYRPKVGEEEPHGLDDVGRFQLVLRQKGGRLFRLLTIGRKRMPDIAGHEREWGFVDLVTEEAGPIAAALKAETYETKTRGVRTRPAARPAGEGGYVLMHGARSLFLAYRLDLPAAPGPVQEELNIAPEAGYVISVKNPEKSAPLLGEDEQAHFPKRTQKALGERRFGGGDPHLLDFEGAEFILIGASDALSAELGGHLEGGSGTPDPAVVLRRLKVPVRDAPLQPLIDGTWA